MGLAGSGGAGGAVCAWTEGEVPMEHREEQQDFQSFQLLTARVAGLHTYTGGSCDARQSRKINVRGDATLP